MEDPSFAQTITYICDHSEEGAMGIVVNKPLAISQTELFQHLDIEDIDANCSQRKVYSGGPVQAERGFVLHRNEGHWHNTVEIAEGICLTTSKDILDDLAHGDGPEDHLIALGYAGWSAQQLDDEISANSWLTVPVDREVIFNTPVENRWQMAAQTLGFDIKLLSSHAGHA